MLVSVPGAEKQRGGAVRPGKALGRHSAAPEAAGKAQGGCRVPGRVQGGESHVARSLEQGGRREGGGNNLTCAPQT